MSGSLSKIVGFGPIRAKAKIAVAKKLTVETMKSAKTVKKKAKNSHKAKSQEEIDQSEVGKRTRRRKNPRKSAKRRISSDDLGCSYLAVGKASMPEETLNGRAIVPRNTVSFDQSVLYSQSDPTTGLNRGCGEVAIDPSSRQHQC